MEIIDRYFSEFTSKQNQQFSALKSLYAEWNSKINVISRQDIDELYLRHVLHSLSIAAVAEFDPGARIVDIGTGGGFPGIPLAIFFPEVHFLLADSIGKKIKVVEAVKSSLGLMNITAMQTRVEELPKQSFDYAISRAVAPLKKLWQWSQPLLVKGECGNLENGLICLKGGDLNAEISESGLKPAIYQIDKFFQEDFFQEKYLLHVAF